MSNSAQALGQCRRYLQDRYSEAEIVQVNSTAKAAQEAGRDPEAFAISPIKCADVYGLQVIDRDIQDAGASECRLPPQGYQSPVRPFTDCRALTHSQYYSLRGTLPPNHSTTYRLSHQPRGVRFWRACPRDSLLKVAELSSKSMIRLGIACAIYL